MAHQAHADALVFFGATGDLARKQIFPALHSMVSQGELDVPIIGVANAGWDVTRLRERAKESVLAKGRADDEHLERLLGLLSYVDGDYKDPETFVKLKAAIGAAKRPAHYLAIPPALFGTVIDGLGPNGIAARVVDVTDRVVRLQTGYLYHYAFAMLLGIAALVTWMMLGSSL